MSRMPAFQTPSRTYKTYDRAKKVIDGLIDGNYRWSILATENGRYAPHVSFTIKDCDLNFHYFISKGCCVTAKG